MIILIIRPLVGLNYLIMKWTCATIEVINMVVV